MTKYCVFWAKKHFDLGVAFFGLECGAQGRMPLGTRSR